MGWYNSNPYGNTYDDPTEGFLSKYQSYLSGMRDPYGSSPASLYTRDPLTTMAMKNAEYQNTLTQNGFSNEIPKSSRSMWDRLMAPLGVGLYPVMNILNDVTKTQPHTVNIGNDIWEGLKGANPFGAKYEAGRKSFSDVLANSGVQNKWVKGIGGFAGDVLLDPVSWLTFGTGGVARALGKEAVGKIAPTIGEDVARELGVTGKEGFRDLLARQVGTKNSVTRLEDKTSTMLDEILNHPEFNIAYGDAMQSGKGGAMERAIGSVDNLLNTNQGKPSYVGLEELLQNTRNRSNLWDSTINQIRNTDARFANTPLVDPKDYAFGFSLPFANKPFMTFGDNNPVTQLFKHTLGAGLSAAGTGTVNLMNKFEPTKQILGSAINLRDKFGEAFNTKFIPFKERDNADSLTNYNKLFNITDQFRNDRQALSDQGTHTVKEIIQPMQEQFGGEANAIFDIMSRMVENPSRFLNKQSNFNGHQFVENPVDISAKPEQLQNLFDLLRQKSNTLSDSAVQARLASTNPAIARAIADQQKLSGRLAQAEIALSNPKSTLPVIQNINDYMTKINQRLGSRSKIIDKAIAAERQNLAPQENQLLVDLFNNRYGLGINDVNELNTQGVRNLQLLLSQYNPKTNPIGSLRDYIANVKATGNFRPGYTFYNEIGDTGKVKQVTLDQPGADLANETMSKLQSLLKGIGSEEKFRGLLKEDMLPGYVPHRYQNKDIVENVWKTNDAFRGLSLQNKSDFSRVFDTLSQAKQYGMRPIENLAQLAGIRASESGRLLAVDNMRNELIHLAENGGDNFVKVKAGLSPDELEQAYRQGFNHLTDGNGRPINGIGSDLLFSPEGRRVMSNVVHLTTDEPSQRYFLDLAHKITNIGKQYATVAASPGFHARNIMGGVMQNALAGYKDPAAYSETLGMLKRYNAGQGLEEMVPGTGLTMGQLFDEAERRGVLNRGRASAAELSDTVAMKLGMNPSNGTVFDLLQNNPLTRAGRSFGNTSENFIRMTMFKEALRDAIKNNGIDTMAVQQGLYHSKVGVPFSKEPGSASKINELLQSGFTPSDGSQFVKNIGIPRQGPLGNALQNASDMVAKFHFDYGDLTNFERDYMKLAFPFYTWLKNNSMLQLNQLMEKPRFYATWNKFKDNMQTTAGISNEDMSYLPPNAEMDYIPTPWKVKSPGIEGAQGKQSSVMWNPNLPLNDINKLGDIRSIASSINPVAKAAIEGVTGKDIFFDRAIEPYPGANYRAPFQPLANLMPDGMFSKSTKYNVDPNTGLGTPEARISGTTKHMIQSVPAFSNLAKLLDPNPENSKYGFDLANFFTGVKPYAYDLEMQKKFHFINENAEMKAAIQRLQTEGKIPDQNPQQQTPLFPKRVNDSRVPALLKLMGGM